jgi:ATP/maltotriose-dependent transcriptional regulator MalT/DNA-binding SARP family transcriptional activator
VELFNQVTRTKILLPSRRPNLLSRQRLLDLFYDLLDHKLIIIAAPAGYGKTSLLVDAAHQVELPTCWYAIDSLDIDLQRFITHFIASISYRFPGFGQRSAAFLQSTTGKLDLDRLLTIIINEVYDHIREYFIVVLDDYHLVDDSEEISHFVNQFAQQVTENCRLIISSRIFPRLSDFDVPLMISRAQLDGLGSVELAFQTDEIQALMLQNHHLAMSDAEAEALAHETEGWITGLQLSTQAMRSGMTNRLRVARVSGVGLYDYLAQQVLDQQPAPVRDFLLQTSLMEEFNAELCEVVLEPGEYPGTTWSGLIDTVLRSNLFVQPVDDGGTWLRYHHLFRDFLQTRLSQEYPQEKERILWRLAEVYIEREAWEKAHDLYQRLDDVGATADLIEQAGLSLVADGRFMSLGKWIDSLPAEVSASRPTLLSLRGYVAVILGEMRQGLELLSRAETLSWAAGDPSCLARILVWQAGAKYILGEYQASLTDAEGALAIAEGDENLRLLQAEALRAKGRSLVLMGQLTEAIACLEQSMALCKVLKDKQNMTRLFLGLGVAYMSAGRYERALTYCKRALDHYQQTGNIVRQAELLNNMGVIYHLRGDYERAASTLEAALTCTRQSKYARFEAIVLCSIGDLYTDLDALEAAKPAYHQAREIVRRIDDHFLLFYLDLAEAILTRLQGTPAKAYNLLHAAKQLAQDSNSDYEQRLCQLELGRLALVEGNVPAAVAHLEAAALHFDTRGQRLDATRSYFYLAVAHQALGDQQEALTHLKHVFQREANFESWHTLVIAGREAKRLLKIAQHDPMVGQQAARLLRRVIQFEQDLPALRRRLRRQTSAVPFAPPKLTIQALGMPQLMIDNKVITSPLWLKQRRVRELLFYFLIHPKDLGLTRLKIGAVFWPESPENELRLRYGNCLYRLRRALDNKDVILFYNEEGEGHYKFNWGMDYEYDVEEFDKQISRARVTTNPAEQAAAYQAAIQLYQGPYLPEMDGDWISGKRYRLANAYIEANLKLGEYYLGISEYRKSLRYCHAILAEDRSQEEAHRMAMRAHAALSNRADIFRQFQDCERVLREELDVSVSDETKKLFQKLIR